MGLIVVCIFVVILGIVCPDKPRKRRRKYR